MHRFFYNKPISGDVLFILIDPDAKAVRTERKGDAVALYDASDRLIGYNVFDVSKTLKIKASGIVFAPSEEFASAVNMLLVNSGFSPLPSLSESGFSIYRVIKTEEHPLDEKSSIATLEGENGKEYTTVSDLKGLDIGSLCVGATDGSILKDGSSFHSHVSKNIPIDVKIMSFADLKISDDAKTAFSPEEGSPGDDFFLGARK